jgi:hypothetical protein
MNYFLYWVTLGGLCLLTACQAPNPSISTPGSTASPSSTKTPTETPVEHTDTPVGASAFGPTGATDADTYPPIAENMLRLSVESLSKLLNFNVDQITVVKVSPVVWRDASLGCTKPGIDYARVETPGYAITLQAGGEVYYYHTNETNRAVLCSPGSLKTSP